MAKWEYFNFDAWKIYHGKSFYISRNYLGVFLIKGRTEEEASKKLFKRLIKEHGKKYSFELNNNTKQ